MGLDNEKIKEAIEFAINNENKVDRNLKKAIQMAFGSEPGFEIKGPTQSRQGPNGIIIKDGYIVGKWGDINRVDMTFSVTKSYLSTVAGLAYQNGFFKLNDKLKNYIKDGKFSSNHNRQITWHHLLNQKMERLKLAHQLLKFSLRIIKVMVLFSKMVMKFMLIK